MATAKTTRFITRCNIHITNKKLKHQIVAFVSHHKDGSQCVESGLGKNMREVILNFAKKVKANNSPIEVVSLREETTTYPRGTKTKDVDGDYR